MRSGLRLVLSVSASPGATQHIMTTTVESFLRAAQQPQCLPPPAQPGAAGAGAEAPPPQVLNTCPPLVLEDEPSPLEALLANTPCLNPLSAALLCSLRLPFSRLVPAILAAAEAAAAAAAAAVAAGGSAAVGTAGQAGVGGGGEGLCRTDDPEALRAVQRVLPYIAFNSMQLLAAHLVAVQRRVTELEAEGEAEAAEQQQQHEQHHHPQHVQQQHHHSHQEHQNRQHRYYGSGGIPGGPYPHPQYDQPVPQEAMLARQPYHESHLPPSRHHMQPPFSHPHPDEVQYRHAHMEEQRHPQPQASAVHEPQYGNPDSPAHGQSVEYGMYGRMGVGAYHVRRVEPAPPYGVPPDSPYGGGYRMQRHAAGRGHHPEDVYDQPYHGYTANSSYGGDGGGMPELDPMAEDDVLLYDDGRLMSHARAEGPYGGDLAGGMRGRRGMDDGGGVGAAGYGTGVVLQGEEELPEMDINLEMELGVDFMDLGGGEDDEGMAASVVRRGLRSQGAGGAAARGGVQLRQQGQVGTRAGEAMARGAHGGRSGGTAAGHGRPAGQGHVLARAAVGGPTQLDADGLLVGSRGGSCTPCAGHLTSVLAGQLQYLLCRVVKCFRTS